MQDTKLQDMKMQDVCFDVIFKVVPALYYKLTTLFVPYVDATFSSLLHFETEAFYVQEAQLPQRHQNVTYTPIPLLHLRPRQGSSPGTISVEFCTEIKMWLRC